MDVGRRLLLLCILVITRVLVLLGHRRFSRGRRGAALGALVSTIDPVITSRRLLRKCDQALISVIIFRLAITAGIDKCLVAKH